MICQDTFSIAGIPIYMGETMNTNDPSSKVCRYLTKHSDAITQLHASVGEAMASFSLTYPADRLYDEHDNEPSFGIVIEMDSTIARQMNLDSSDQFLELALQDNDFTTIRAILNRKGYDIPLTEPNDLVLPPERNTKIAESTGIQTYLAGYGVWETPPQTAESEPLEERLTIQESFATELAENFHFRLERLIRRKDAVMLRMWLRLFGHDILPNQPGEEEDLLDEFRFQGNHMPEPSSNS